MDRAYGTPSRRIKIRRYKISRADGSATSPESLYKINPAIFVIPF